MQIFRNRLSLLAAAYLLLGTLAPAQGTKQWTTTRFDEFERGTPVNVAIRNDGRLEAAPRLRMLTSTNATYLWSLLTKGGQAGGVV